MACRRPLNKSGWARTGRRVKFPHDGRDLNGALNMQSPWKKEGRRVAVPKTSPAVGYFEEILARVRGPSSSWASKSSATLESGAIFTPPPRARGRGQGFPAALGAAGRDHALLEIRANQAMGPHALEPREIGLDDIARWNRSGRKRLLPPAVARAGDRPDSPGARGPSRRALRGSRRNWVPGQMGLWALMTMALPGGAFSRRWSNNPERVFEVGGRVCNWVKSPDPNAACCGIVWPRRAPPTLGPGGDPLSRRQIDGSEGLSLRWPPRSPKNPGENAPAMTRPAEGADS